MRYMRLDVPVEFGLKLEVDVEELPDEDGNNF